MYPTTKNQGLFKNKQNKATENNYKEDKTYVLNIDLWNTVTIILLLAMLFLHGKSIVGWLDGTTMVSQFGMDSVLATAIARCPDLLFHATYYSLALSAIMLVVTFVMLYRFLCDKTDSYDALSVSVICSIVTTWAFPFIHAILDLGATALNIRDTSGFDVGQLGIDLQPMIIITVVYFVILWLNKRVDNLT